MRWEAGDRRGSPARRCAKSAAMRHDGEATPIELEHYAFVTEVALVEDASRALHEFAETDDVPVLERMLGDWCWIRTEARCAARVVPRPGEWSHVARGLAQESIDGLGPLREVGRHDFEVLRRAVDRLARVRALNGPEFL